MNKMSFIYKAKLAILAILLAIAVSSTAWARDWRTWPFSSSSPWNYPIGNSAQYSDVPGLKLLTMGLNYNNHWTSGVYISKITDRIGRLHFRKDMWLLLNNGIRNSGNPPEVEQRLRSGATGKPPLGNDYVTTVAGSSSFVWPEVFHRTTDTYYSRTFYMPEKATPSPDTDGLISIVQPNGWVLDAVNAVVLSNGDIVCKVASYISALDEGTGWSNGRRASMFPSFAGLIRDGEISFGDIRHALVALMSPRILKEQAIWPAYAWDGNSGYTGTLPMGALLAIPPEVDTNNIGLTDKGKVIARAAQDYGIYVGDRGGADGISLLAELNAKDIRWDGIWNDLEIIKKHLRWVINNSEDKRGGGGALRRPLAPEVKLLPSPANVTVTPHTIK